MIIISGKEKIMKTTVKLKDIASYSKGSQINGNNLIEDGAYEYLNGGINPSGKWNEYNVDGNTITISEGGNSCGYVNYMINPFWCGAHCYYLYNLKCSSKYLYYALKGNQNSIMKLRSGACMPNIKKKDLGEFILSIDLDKKEQDKTIKIFNKLQSIITHFRTQLEKLDLLVKARFVEMFGDIYTNKYDLPICPLSDYITFLTSGSRGWAKYCTENGTDWFITIKNVKACKITTHNIQQLNAPDNMEAKRTKVQEDDLLISITADLGRTGVVTKEIAEHGAYINQHLTCVRLNKSKITPIYAAYFMESDSGRPQFEAKNQTGVKAGLNFDSIKSLKILVPPLTLQNQFADFVKQVDQSKSILQQELDKAQMLFDSLMQEYFG